MPGAPCKVINFTHLVVGMDMHKNMPPPAPAGPVPMPHLVATCIGDAMIATSKEAPTVKAGGASAVARQHDVGMGLFPARGPGYHTAGNLLLPIVWLGAGNKCEFGSSTVKVPTGRIAVALVPVAGLNPQLDCFEPAPFIGSLCISSMNTVMAGFTWMDCLAGFVAMAVDSVAVWIVGKISGAIVGVVAAGAGALITGILAEAAPEVLLALGLALASPVGAAVAANAAEGAGQGAEGLVGWVIGSPLGYSFDLPWTGWGGALNDKITDFISPAPTAPAPPPLAPAPAPPSSPASPETPAGSSSDDGRSEPER